MGITGYTFTVQHLISSGPQAGTMETLPYTPPPEPPPGLGWGLGVVTA